VIDKKLKYIVCVHLIWIIYTYTYTYTYTTPRTMASHCHCTWCYDYENTRNWLRGRIASVKHMAWLMANPDMNKSYRFRNTDYDTAHDMIRGCQNAHDVNSCFDEFESPAEDSAQSAIATNKCCLKCKSAFIAEYTLFKEQYDILLTYVRAYAKLTAHIPPSREDEITALNAYLAHLRELDMQGRDADDKSKLLKDALMEVYARRKQYAAPNVNDDEYMRAVNALNVRYSMCGTY
jgi:hypothetical protein